MPAIKVIELLFVVLVPLSTVPVETPEAVVPAGTVKLIVCTYPELTIALELEVTGNELPFIPLVVPLTPVK
jgi:hypothetical protein